MLVSFDASIETNKRSNKLSLLLAINFLNVNELKGDAKLTFDEITLGDNAKINGSLNYKAPQTNEQLEGISKGEVIYKSSVKTDSKKFLWGFIK